MPSKTIPAPAPARRRRTDYGVLKLLVLDVDGVLTDGGLYVSEDGRTMKRYAIIDGAGLVYWREAGFKTAIISGHDCKSVQARFQGLGVDEIHVGVKDKLALFERLLIKLKLTAAETAAVGDDLMDLPLLKRVGFAACPPTSHPRCKAAAHYVTQADGGRGAVREVIERILARNGRLEAVTARFER